MPIHWQQRLNQALGLQVEGQDWGMENTAPRRIMKFIAFYKTHSLHHAWEPEALAELILESANESLEKNLLSTEQAAGVASFLASNHEHFPETSRHWAQYQKNQWPVVELLKAAGIFATRNT